MGIASTAKQAKQKHQSSWLTPGDYDLLQVVGLKEIDKPGKLLFIVELDILSASGDEAVREGLDGAFCVDCLKFDGGLASEVNEFFMGLYDCSYEAVGEKGYIEKGLSADQPYVGALIRCKAYTHTTANGAHVTRYKWSPITDKETINAVPQLREALGLSDLPVIATVG